MKRTYENDDDARENRVRRKYDRPSVTTMTNAELIEALGPAFAGYGDPTGGLDPGWS